MPHIHLQCPLCGQSVEVPEGLANELVDCPKCKGIIDVAAARHPPQPETPPAPQLPPQPPPNLRPVQSYAPQSVRRHSIFYYVFWATISLVATLAILFVGFIFLTAAGAGFLTALTGHTPNSTGKAPTLAVRNLPALTEDETRTAKTLIGNLRVKKDDIEGVTWYSPSVAEGYGTAVYLYIGKKETGAPWLRWKIRYYGENWLFIQEYRIKIDNEDAKTLLPNGQIKHDSSGGSVWEIFDESASEHAQLLNQILASETTYLRMKGTGGMNDIQLGPLHIKQMRDVLLVFRYLGGVWSTN